MEPEIIYGDHVLVCKLVPGARLFDIFAASRGEQVKIRRLPGIRKTKRNDVMVFNIPYPFGSDKMKMDITQYYIKRCIALPGDTLRIKESMYHITGIEKIPGNLKAQQSQFMDSISTTDKSIFPQDTLLNWNTQDFGPLYIPRAGDRIGMNPIHYALYRKIIEWEQQAVLEKRGDQYYLQDQPISSYCFTNNYYFMGGDRVQDSRDSRYWGLLPEEYIVGKAFLIWRSKDPYFDEIRWNRFFKRIH